MVTEPYRWSIKRLTSDDDISGIDCGNEWWQKDVVNFLKEDALSQQANGLNTTFLFYHNNQLTGFTSLFASSLRIDDDKSLAARPGLDVGYKEFPCVTIGQFGVDLKYQGKGFGSQMLAWVRAEVLTASFGVRFLTLHVANANTDGRAFWKKLGFTNLPKRSGGKYTFMFYDLYHS